MNREAFEKAYHKETGLYASYAPNKKGYTDVIAGMCYRIWQSALKHSGEPVVDEAVFDILKAAQGSCRLGFNDIAEKQIQIAIKALLSAGKENNNE